MARYSTALSHIVLTGTSFYCLGVLNSKYTSILDTSFTIMAVNSLFGIWRWGNPTYGYKVDKLYKFTSLLQDLFVLPCIVTTIWLEYNYIREMAYAHTLVVLLPLISYFVDSENTELIDSILIANCVSLGYVSAVNGNYFGLSTIASFFISHFVIKRDVVDLSSRSLMDIPSQDLYNYAMCFFAIFALRAVMDVT